MVSCASIFFDVVSDSDHNGMIEGTLDVRVQEFIRRIDEVMMLMICVVKINVSDA